jgi:hypothetical protein
MDAFVISSLPSPMLEPAAADGTTDFSVLQNELLRALKGADVSQEQKCR